MRYVQLALLAVFAVCAVISFVMRLRMGALNGAISRGEKSEDLRQAADRYLHWALRFAVGGAAALIVCAVLGALSSV